MAGRALVVPPRAFGAVVLLLTVTPLAELALLVWLGRRIGLWPTLAACAATGFAGAWLARAEGLRTVGLAREALAAGRFPGREIPDGACILAGAVLLLTPGLVTDALGLALLVPPGRRLVQRALRRAFDRAQGVIDVRPERP